MVGFEVLTAFVARRFGTGGPLLASSYDPYPLPSLAPKATHSFQVRLMLRTSQCMSHRQDTAVFLCGRLCRRDIVRS